MTVGEALDVSKRSVSSREAEIFLGVVLGTSRADIVAHPERVLTNAQVAQYETYLTRRETNEPVAYITGEKEFYGRPFACDKRALIPRPETEGVVEHALAYIERWQAEHMAANVPCPIRVLELGTGCGCIAVTLACECTERGIPLTIVATDISPDALTLAQENWLALGKPNANTVVSFVEADLFDAPEIKKRPFDLVVANLPYVETTWQVETGAQPDVIFYEPDVALFGGEDGLDIYRRFFAEVEAHTTNEAPIIVEYGDTQTAAILPLVEAAFPDAKIEVHQDYARLDRTLVIKR